MCHLVTCIAYTIGYLKKEGTNVTREEFNTYFNEFSSYVVENDLLTMQKYLRKALVVKSLRNKNIELFMLSILTIITKKHLSEVK